MIQMAVGVDVKVCKKCGGEYSDVFFRNTGVKKFGNYSSQKYHRVICIGCELTARTEAKQGKNQPTHMA